VGGPQGTDVQPIADAIAGEGDQDGVASLRGDDARRRLIVAGCGGVRARPAGCWYDLTSRACATATGSGGRRGRAQIWRYRKVTAAATGAPAGPTSAAAAPPASSPWPAWLRRNAPAEAERPVAITPSEGDDTMPSERALGSGEGRAVAIARGLVIHRLMQSLPDIAPERRAEAARHFVARAGHAFTAAEQDGFVAGAALIDEPRSPLFSRAAAPRSRSSRAPRPARQGAAHRPARSAASPSPPAKC
jgi:ATP-dependent helicase/nuclease subunit A